MKGIPTRYPIVLCHGLFGFKRLFPSEIGFRVGVEDQYFRGIVSFLRSQGHTIWCPEVPKSSSIRERATTLYQYIQRKFNDGSWDIHTKNLAKKGILVSDTDVNVNLVGHSMGGLDGRYLLSLLDGYRFTTSLTTIGTPHRGSSFADICVKRIGIDLKVEAALQTLGIPTGAFTDLTREKMDIFNSNVLDQSSVKYRSYAGVCTRSNVHVPLYIPHTIVKHYEGENDGLVSLESARWGESCKEVELDHLAQINWHRVFLPSPSPKEYDAYGRFLLVCSYIYMCVCVCVCVSLSLSLCVVFFN